METILRILESVGACALKVWAAVIYETRRDSVLSLKKLSGRQLLLDDVVKHAIPGFTGADPAAKGKTWVHPEDYELVRVPKTNQEEPYLNIVFHRKITYTPENPAHAPLAFVAGSRKVRYGELTSRKVRAIFSLASHIADLVSKIRH